MKSTHEFVSFPPLPSSCQIRSSALVVCAQRAGLVLGRCTRHVRTCMLHLVLPGRGALFVRSATDKNILGSNDFGQVQHKKAPSSARTPSSTIKCMHKKAPSSTRTPSSTIKCMHTLRLLRQGSCACTRRHHQVHAHHQAPSSACTRRHHQVHTHHQAPSSAYTRKHHARHQVHAHHQAPSSACTPSGCLAKAHVHAQPQPLPQSRTNTAQCTHHAHPLALSIRNVSRLACWIFCCCKHTTLHPVLLRRCCSSNAAVGTQSQVLVSRLCDESAVTEGYDLHAVVQQMQQ